MDNKSKSENQFGENLNVSEYKALENKNVSENIYVSENLNIFVNKIEENQDFSGSFYQNDYKENHNFTELHDGGQRNHAVINENHNATKDFKDFKGHDNYGRLQKLNLTFVFNNYLKAFENKSSNNHYNSTLESNDVSNGSIKDSYENDETYYYNVAKEKSSENNNSLDFYHNFNLTAWKILNSFEGKFSKDYYNGKTVVKEEYIAGRLAIYDILFICAFLIFLLVLSVYIDKNIP